MNTLFLIVCGISVVFFAVFLLECSRPRRKARTTQVTRKSVEAEVVEPTTGWQFLAHIEQQMAEFFAHRGHTAA
jgi:hypothetical protein